MQDIPTIDLARNTPATIRGVESACRDLGFMYVRGHGIPDTVIARIREAVIGYFSRPLDEKLRDRVSRDNYRGYIPQGFFSPNRGDREADRYEGYKLHFEADADDPIREDCDLYGPNKWPDDSNELRAAVLDYWQACDRVAFALLARLAAILDVNEESFIDKFDKPLTNMTLLHYPPQEASSTGFGIHPHKDTDALTILVPDKVGGLMLRPRNEQQWIEVVAPDGALVVNLGDMLELWSGGYFVSTPHKVVNRSGAERYSFPYFAVPRFDTVVEPLRDPQPGFARASIHVGDASRQIWQSNWPDAAPIGADLDPGLMQ